MGNFYFKFILSGLLFVGFISITSCTNMNSNTDLNSNSEQVDYEMDMDITVNLETKEIYMVGSLDSDEMWNKAILVNIMGVPAGKYTMVKHEYNVITGSSYTCDVVERRQLIIKGFKTDKKSKKQKYGKEQR